MRLIREVSGLPASLRGAALAIGNFDGLHLGHFAVLSEMLRIAAVSGITPAVMTFEPHPRMFFTPRHAPHRIEPLHIKLRRLRQAGVKTVYLLRFNDALSKMSAERFVADILQDALDVSHVVTGENFVFGHRRGGDSALLRRAAVEGAFGYSAVSPLMLGEWPCSSSRVRACLTAGDMPGAARLLGRPYEITGRVAHGEARGRALGAPTANLLPTADLFLPVFGVYAVRYRVSHGAMAEDAGIWLPGVANLGVRPSFGGGAPRLEVHGLEEARDLYGMRLRVRFEAFLREEIHFPSAERLASQISADILRAREALGI